MAATVLPSTPGGPGIPGGGPGLLVRTRNDDLRFGTHAPVRIGREPGLEVTIDDAGVSRQHALVEPRPDGWWFVDRSNSGSFVEGERVTQLKLEEPTTVLLGHPTAGYELELVPVLAAAAASAADRGQEAAQDPRGRRPPRWPCWWSSAAASPPPWSSPATTTSRHRPRR